MLLPVSRHANAFYQIRDDARSDQSAVLILVADDCDAISACHIFTGFLRADDVAYSLNPVHSYQDVESIIQSRDVNSYRSIVMFNCGASMDLEDRLRMSEESWNRSKIYVIDSHRPVHFNNVYFDRTPCTDDYGNHYFEDRIEDAKVIILDDQEEISEEVPSFEEAVLYDEEFDDYDDEESSPAHRRRVGEGSDQNSTLDEDVTEQDRRSKRKKREANLKIEKYSSRGHRSQASAWMMFSLALKLNRESNESLWWGILGFTDQYLSHEVGQTEYESALRVAAEEVARLNAHTGNNGRISFVQDFRFVLLRHWNLYESMYHTQYVASNLQLWKDTKNDSNQLRTLLAKMGIPRSEAQQKFMSMKASIHDNLESKLNEWSETFRMPDFQFPTFHKSRHLAHDLAIADCYYITSAMLSFPRLSDGKWEASFYKAYDAIQWCSSREDLWDQLVSENSNAVADALRLHKVVIEKTFEILNSKSPMGHIGVAMGGFRYVRIAIDDVDCLLAQPIALKQIGHFLAHNHARNRKSQNCRLIIGVEDSTKGKCSVVGVECLLSSGFQAPNTFGRLFQIAIQMARNELPDIEMQEESFDTECVKFSNCSFSNFLSYVNAAQDRLYECEQRLQRLMEDDEQSDQDQPDQDQPDQDQADGQIQ